MKRFFLVEANTDYESLFAYELVENSYNDGGQRQFVQPDIHLFNRTNREEFFGTLNSLCKTKEVFSAPPMRLVAPAPASDEFPQHVQDFLDCPVAESETTLEMVERVVPE